MKEANNSFMQLFPADRRIATESYFPHRVLHYHTKYQPNGQVILEIHNFEKSSNLIGR